MRTGDLTRDVFCRGFSPSRRTAAIFCVAWLGGMLTSPTLAQSKINLSFPVTTIEPARDRQVEPLKQRVWLAGGSCAQLVEIGVDSARQQPWEFPGIRVNGISSRSEQLFVAGVENFEYGYLACFSTGDRQLDWTRQDLPDPLTCLCVAEDVVIVGSDRGTVYASDIESGLPLWQVDLHSKMVTALVAVGDGLCASGDWTGKIVIFDADTGAVTAEFQQHRDRIIELLVDQRGGRLYSGSHDGTVRMWYPIQGRLVRFVQLQHPVTAVSSLATDQVVVATHDGQVHLVDLSEARVLNSVPSGLGYVHALHHVDGKQILLSDGRTEVRILELDVVP